METPATLNLVETYLTMLKHVDRNVKLELIARLAEQLKTVEEKPSQSALDELFGAWDSDQTPEELANELREARTPNRDFSFEE